MDPNGTEAGRQLTVGCSHSQLTLLQHEESESEGVLALGGLVAIPARHTETRSCNGPDDAVDAAPAAPLLPTK